jgi:hypothetical protein
LGFKSWIEPFAPLLTRLMRSLRSASWKATSSYLPFAIALRGLEEQCVK